MLDYHYYFSYYSFSPVVIRRKLLITIHTIVLSTADCIWAMDNHQVFSFISSLFHSFNHSSFSFPSFQCFSLLYLLICKESYWLSWCMTRNPTTNHKMCAANWLSAIFNAGMDFAVFVCVWLQIPSLVKAYNRKEGKKFFFFFFFFKENGGVDKLEFVTLSSSFLFIFFLSAFLLLLNH